MADHSHSPCTGSCVLGVNGQCSVCLRTIQEIVHWGEFSEQDRRRVLDRIESIRKPELQAR